MKRRHMLADGALVIGLFSVIFGASARFDAMGIQEVPFYLAALGFLLPVGILLQLTVRRRSASRVTPLAFVAVWLVCIAIVIGWVVFAFK